MLGKEAGEDWDIEGFEVIAGGFYVGGWSSLNGDGYVHETVVGNEGEVVFIGPCEAGTSKDVVGSRDSIV
jgi:hypothetical protein